MTPRTLLAAALCCAAVLFTGCGKQLTAKKAAKPTGAKGDTKQDVGPVTDAANVGPMESYSADAEFDPKTNARHFLLYSGFSRRWSDLEGPFSPAEIHRGHVEDFIRRPGVGIGRTGPYWPSVASDWIELVAVSPGERGSRGNRDGDEALSHRPVAILTLNNGTRLARRERVWLLESRQLMSVNAPTGPTVYLNAPRSQHYLTQSNWNSKTADKMRLDSFEEAALKQLRAGDEVVLRSDSHKLRMLGAVRSRKDCLSCHKGEVGALLGAFTYMLNLQSEETPLAHRLADPTGLTAQQLSAVRTIEAVGGKLIRTPNGPVTEAWMTFSRNQELVDKPGRHSTRLPLRNSALPLLLAFPDLTAVDVSDSLVTDEGLKTLTELKSLKRLNLRGTWVKEEGVAELKKALPKCEILSDLSVPPP